MYELILSKEDLLLIKELLRVHVKRTNLSKESIVCLLNEIKLMKSQDLLLVIPLLNKEDRNKVNFLLDVIVLRDSVSCFSGNLININEEKEIFSYL